MSGYDPTPYLDPEQCAVIVFECQQMVLGPDGPYPGLVASVRETGMLERLAGLCDAGRDAGAAIVYCTVSGRADGLGAAKTPMLDRLRAGGGSGGSVPGDRSIVPELAPQDGDVVLERSHGMSPFAGTDLDIVLRDLGVETVIPTGVSANIGVVGTAIEAVNHGYRLVFATDCIAADPPEYGEQMLRYTFRNLGYLSTAGAIADYWRIAA